MAFLLGYLFAFAFLINAGAQAQPMQSNISRGASLTPTTNNSSWVSSSGLFAFGFHKLEGSDGYVVGIVVAGNPQKTLVWSAKEDDEGDELAFIVSDNATLTLTTEGISLQWTTREAISVATPTSGQSVFSASMRDSGNFVMYNSVQEIVWQSFEHPTDTLLPNQRLLSGQQLFSAKSKSDPSTGKFRLKMQKDGYLVQYPVNTPDTAPYAYIAWYSFTWGDNVTLYLDADGHLCLLNGTGSIIVNITDGHRGTNPTDRGKYYLMRLDIDGIFRLYSHSMKQNGSWSDEWSSSNDKCDPKGICGFNSYCVTMDQQADCKCLPGFKSVNSGNQTSECGSNSVGDVCNSKNENFSYTMQEVASTSWENDAYMTLSLSDKEDCKTACLEDCICEAALFEGRSCRKQRLPLRYGRRQLSISSMTLIKEKFSKDGNESTNFVIPELIQKKPSRWKIDKRIWIGTATATAAALLAISLCIIIRFLLPRRKLAGENRRNIQDILVKMKSNRPTDLANGIKNNENVKHDISVFSYASIKAATRNFSDDTKLGKGGFGPVYKGKMGTGQEVAVKRLSKVSGQGALEFQNELILIYELQHKNLVQLFGFCIHGEERMLIYEYLPNKSLDYFLFDSTRGQQLDWKKRFTIIDGIAQGLLYLHKYSRMTVIHRDLKASNVLLDGNMNPKISDFGMSRIFAHDEQEAQTRRIVGTKGYMSPEYVMGGNFSTKSDVYSFGVLMLEIVSGRRNNSFYNDDHAFNLVDYAWTLRRESAELELMDPIIGDSCIKEQLLRCIHVGLLCVEETAANRPTMLDVISMLTTENMSLPEPVKPAFCAERNVIAAGIGGNEPEIAVSVNGMSNSDFFGGR